MSWVNQLVQIDNDEPHPNLIQANMHKLMANWTEHTQRSRLSHDMIVRIWTTSSPKLCRNSPRAQFHKWCKFCGIRNCVKLCEIVVKLSRNCPILVCKSWMFWARSICYNYKSRTSFSKCPWIPVCSRCFSFRMHSPLLHWSNDFFDFSITFQ